MQFSLIVPTVERTQDLGRLLRSVMDQRFRTVKSDLMEVIVVDQNDDDRLVPILAAFGSSLNIRHIKQKVRGLALAKNAGLQVASGDVVCFSDDDCWYEENALENAYQKLAEAHFKIGVFGVALDPALGRTLLRYPPVMRVLSSRNLPEAFLGVQIAQFYPRSLVEKVGGFDVRFGVGARWGSGEDTDLALKVMESGASIVFDPGIHVYHPMVDFRSMADHKVRLYSEGFGALCRKHGLIGHWAAKVLKQSAGAFCFLMLGKWPRAKYCWLTAYHRWRGFWSYREDR